MFLGCYSESTKFGLKEWEIVDTSLSGNSGLSICLSFSYASMMKGADPRDWNVLFKKQKKNWIANSDLAELEKLIDVGSLLEKHEEHNW